MAGSVNKVILIGNLGKDPEIRTISDGKEVANLTLATSDSWRDKSTDERRERTEWHNIVIFSQGLINIAKNYLKKGSKIYLEGALQTRKWTDKSGREKYTTEIILQGFNAVLTMLDSNKSGSTSVNNTSYTKSEDSPSTSPAYSSGPINADINDEVPF